MSAIQSPDSMPAFRDHSTGLKVFGIFQILIGCICLLFAVGFVIIIFLPASGPFSQNMNGKFMIPGIVFYVTSSVGFIWLGIGSFLARRWAWTLTVILSSIWLVFGIAMIIPMGFMMTKTMANAQQANIALAAGVISIAVMSVIYILLPAMFLLFYNRASVHVTCQRRDPKVRWTDGCPMPVLAICLILTYSAFSMPMTWAYNFMICFFGFILSGITGAIISLLIMILCLYLAYSSYKLKMKAWWGTLLLWLAGCTSMILTFSRVNLIEMYEKMGYSEQMIEIIRKMENTGGMFGPMIWAAAIFGVVAFGYMLYVRRYFIFIAQKR
jgi:hypothetical protein